MLSLTVSSIPVQPEDSGSKASDCPPVADVGQEEDFEAARAKALKIGAKKFILDVRVLLPKSLSDTLTRCAGPQIRIHH